MKEKFRRPWQAAWDKRKLRTIGTKLTLKQATALREACDAAGMTPYRLTQKLLLEWLQGQRQQIGKREAPPAEKAYSEGFYVKW